MYQVMRVSACAFVCLCVCVFMCPCLSCTSDWSDNVLGSISIDSNRKEGGGKERSLPQF